MVNVKIVTVIYGMNVIEFNPPKRERGCCGPLGEKQYYINGVQMWAFEGRFFIKRALEDAVFADASWGSSMLFPGEAMDNQQNKGGP